MSGDTFNATLRINVLNRFNDFPSSRGYQQFYESSFQLLFQNLVESTNYHIVPFVRPLVLKFHFLLCFCCVHRVNITGVDHMGTTYRYERVFLKNWKVRSEFWQKRDKCTVPSLFTPEKIEITWSSLSESCSCHKVRYVSVLQNISTYTSTRIAAVHWNVREKISQTLWQPHCYAERHVPSIVV